VKEKFAPQMTTFHFSNEARDLVRAAVNATDEDEIVFCSNPADRLCYLLANIFARCSANTDSSSSETCDKSKSVQQVPILFVSSVEPILNIQTWIDAGYQVERISKNREGFLDLVDLEKRLNEYYGSRKMVGLFSGASRLSGILADDVATTILLHQYGALSIWDYSTSAACAPILTNPLLPGAAKDAVYFYCNKLIGGVQAPGVLVIKKALLENISSFTHDSVGVVSAVRAGLVLQLKETLGTQAIMTRMEKVCK
jgi:selenocysteine lyase/cysteine desulfurase